MPQPKKAGQYADRLDNLRVVDPVLTELTRGYTNNQLISESLAPVVPLEKETAKIVQFGKEAFMIYPTERAIRGKSNRINPQGRTTIDISLAEHDLEYPIDYREQEEDIFQGLKEHGAMVAAEGIAMRREKIAADLFQDPNSYPTNHKVTLTSGDQWTDYANSNPINDIKVGKEKIRSKIGRKPNMLVMGVSAFNTLQTHTKLLDLIKYTGNGSRQLITAEILKGLFEIEEIVVGEPVYSSDAEVFSDVWGDNAILAWVNKGATRTKNDPSFAYTFRKKNQPLVDAYTESGGKVDIVRTTDIFTVKIVGGEAGYLIKDTNL